MTGGEAAPSISKVLERATCAGVDDILDGIENVVRSYGGTS